MVVPGVAVATAAGITVGVSAGANGTLGSLIAGLASANAPVYEAAPAQAPLAQAAPPALSAAGIAGLLSGNSAATAQNALTLRTAQVASRGAARGSTVSGSLLSGGLSFSGAGTTGVSAVAKPAVVSGVALTGVAATSAVNGVFAAVQQQAGAQASAVAASERRAAKAKAAAVAAQATAAKAMSGMSPREIGRLLAAQRGWGGAQFQCLNSLWTKESGWIATADNPSSSAYGIPQSLPGTKMASEGADWRTNPATQIRWGLKYIAERYGTPCSAWAHSRAVNWY